MKPQKYNTGVTCVTPGMLGMFAGGGDIAKGDCFKNKSESRSNTILVPKKRIIGRSKTT